MKHLVILMGLFLGFMTARGEVTRIVIRSHYPEKQHANISTVRGGRAQFLLGASLMPGATCERGVKIEEKKYYTLVYNSVQYDLLIEPGQQVEIDLLADGTISLTGKYGELNNLLTRLKREASSGDKYKLLLLKAKEIVLDRERSSFYTEQYRAQVKEVKRSGLAGEDERIALGYVQALLLQNIYKPVCESKVFGKSNKAVIEADYAVELAGLEPETYLFYYQDWVEYLRELMYTKMQTGKIRLRNPELWISGWAGTISSRLLREQFIAGLIEREVIMGYSDPMVKERCQKAGGMIKDPRLAQKAEADIAKIESFPTDVDVASVTVENAGGQKVSLGEFKGKYVFLDFWGTFCNPCIGELPYLHRLEEELKDTPIEFVSVCMDNRKEGWKGFLKNHDMDHNQFIMLDGPENPIWNLIGLSGIPRFVLVGPDSKVISKSTYRPSNPILELQLRNIVKQK